MAASDETKPLFASTWHGELNLDELRQEIEFIYSILREGGLVPPSMVTPPTSTGSGSGAVVVPTGTVVYDGTVVTYLGGSVTYA